MVIGQVYNSNALTFEPRKSARWYLERAGGATRLADRNAIFIVRANGAVVSGKGGLLSGGALSARIGPGDTIVVPEKSIGGGTVWKNPLAISQAASAGSVAAVVAERWGWS